MSGDCDQRGYPSIDSWVNDFVASWSEMEYNDVGQLVEVFRPRRYANVYALRLLWENKVDVIRNEDLAFSLPKLVDEDGNEAETPNVVVVELPDGGADPRITDFMLHNLARWEYIQSIGAIQAREEGLSFFSVMWDGRKASIDARLVTSEDALSTILSAGRVLDNSRPFDRSKIEVATERIVKFLDDTKDIRATVMVFSEFGVQPNGYQGFSMYEALRQALIDGGVPANEIAFIRDAGGDATAKQRMLDRMNAGEIRVMLGTHDKPGDRGERTEAPRLPRPPRRSVEAVRDPAARGTDHPTGQLAR